MAAIYNTTNAQDTVAALDIEFIKAFDGEVNQLTSLLGIFSPETYRAGTAMYTYTVAGRLADVTNYCASSDTSVVPGKTYYTHGIADYTPVADPGGADNPAQSGWYELLDSSGTGYVEGDEVSLSKYALEKHPIGEFQVIPYRRLTTAQAIMKGGFENAVLRQDRRMVQDIRGGILERFFTTLGDSATFVSDASYADQPLQAALEYTDATLLGAMEDNKDSTDRIVHFVNRFDIAEYLANATITTQTAFGMTYLESFLGVTDIFVTNRVGKGTIIATPAENIHLYGLDYGELATAGLSYTVSDSGLIGVHHEAAYDRASCETHAMVGCSLVPEISTYIVGNTVVRSA